MVAAFLLGGAAPPSPPLPDVLKPYIQNGRFEPGDYGWARGHFADATPAEKVAYQAITQWRSRCVETGQEELRVALRNAGYPNSNVKGLIAGDPLCTDFTIPPPLSVTSFAEFKKIVGEARPIASTFLAAVDVADQSNAPRESGLAEQLKARPLAEQMLRQAFNWGQGEMTRAPALSADVRAMVMSMLWAETVRRDRANTEWLKKIVAAEGWPKRSGVGAPASEQAWLLVQHADHDPLFQLQVLRLMEPMLASGEVSKRNHAYLYDRVMLKLAGKQRYGTQAHCDKGKLVPRPLEDEARVAQLRTTADLEPLDDYIAMMRTHGMPCPPAT